MLILSIKIQKRELVKIEFKLRSTYLPTVETRLRPCVVNRCCVTLSRRSFVLQHIAILDIDEAVGVAFQDELNKQHGAGKSKFYRVDVTSEEQLLAAFQSVVAEQGGIDVVVNNAGIMNDAPHVYKKEIEINVVS